MSLIALTAFSLLMALLLRAQGGGSGTVASFSSADAVGSNTSGCDSITASAYGGWKPVKTAPRDGTIVEMLETYGVAPWYGLFKWTTDMLVIDGLTQKPIHLKSDTPGWQSVDKPGSSVVEDGCLFWRPYKSVGRGKYVDPTNGAQKSTAYWCSHMHMRYDKKTDSCK